MVGELSFFLGLQIKQTEFVIFISQPKYARELLKKFVKYILKTLEDTHEHYS